VADLGLVDPSKKHAFADDVNLLGENINNINRNTQAVWDAGNEVGLQVNAGKTM
jgi:hypothetical protein